MEKGDIRVIYQKPLTEEEPEGEARLVERLHISRYMEFWDVAFTTEPGQVYARWIKRDNIVCEK